MLFREEILEILQHLRGATRNRAPLSRRSCGVQKRGNRPTPKQPLL